MQPAGAEADYGFTGTLGFDFGQYISHQEERTSEQS